MLQLQSSFAVPSKNGEFEESSKLNRIFKAVIQLLSACNKSRSTAAKCARRQSTITVESIFFKKLSSRKKYQCCTYSQICFLFPQFCLVETLSLKRSMLLKVCFSECRNDLKQIKDSENTYFHMNCGFRFEMNFRFISHR